MIFPTLARRERAPSLRRALASVLDQEGVRAVPLVVINGADHDADLVRELRADHRLRVTSVEPRGIPEALHAGRHLVDTPWFSELDDDDVMLPGGLALRLAALEAGPELDAVVTNGYRRNAGRDTLHVSDPAAVRHDPLGALLTGNWLLPGSWLSRTGRVGPDVFRDMPHSLECTYLAVRFATGRMAFLEQPTVVWHTDDPNSESKSRAFHLGEANALRRILELDLPPAFKKGVRRKITDACHAVAARELRDGDPEQAWRWHLRSLRGRGGWRFLLFSRHVLSALARGRTG